MISPYSAPTIPEIKTNELDLSKINDFGLFMFTNTNLISIPISYQIESVQVEIFENSCYNLQFFFSDKKSIGISYLPKYNNVFELNLEGIQNNIDLIDYEKNYKLIYSDFRIELKNDLFTFRQSLNLGSSDLYLNMLCPYWKDNKKEIEGIITTSKFGALNSTPTIESMFTFSPLITPEELLLNIRNKLSHEKTVKSQIQSYSAEDNYKTSKVLTNSRKLNYSKMTQNLPNILKLTHLKIHFMFLQIKKLQDIYFISPKIIFLNKNIFTILQ